jgi:CubicO group peptidase (beta-lactamase class C family)
MRWCLLSLLILCSCALFKRTPLLNPSEEMAKLRETYQLPALAAVLSVDNQIMFQEAQGLRKMGAPIGVQEEDKFHLGSCTKAMTATLVAKFVERGLFAWKTKLSTLLPHLKFDESLKDLSIEALLSHHSGLSANPEPALAKKLRRLKVQPARREIAKVYLSQKSEFSPNDFHYSNVGYIILGHVLEHLTKKSWEELMSTELFKPLEMRSCGFGVTSSAREKSPTQPWGHTIIGGNKTALQEDNYPLYGPSGTVHCNLLDWQKFIQLHVDGFKGESSFLKPETFKKLHSTPKASESYTFGGWVRVERAWAKGPAFTHSGTNTFNYATTWWAPNRELITMSVTNTFADDTHEALDKMVTRLIYHYPTK